MSAKRSSAGILILLATLPILLAPLTAHGDGVVVDRIYHPYVQPLEQEFEWRAIVQHEQPDIPDHLWLHKLGYGRSFGDRWFGEAYLIGKRSTEQGFDIEAYEIEARRQMSEQGELWADWGVMFELEREARANRWELTAALLAEKEWGRWSGTANLALIQEWGKDFADEIESSLGLQWRYRYSPGFEPALELYSGQNSKGIGPVVRGQLRPAHGRRLLWEAGLIYGLGAESPDRTARLLVEFEF